MSTTFRLKTQAGQSRRGVLSGCPEPITGYGVTSVNLPPADRAAAQPGPPPGLRDAAPPACSRRTT